ncbi:MAG: hypothetical protein ACO1Q7_09440 [Gemmatimonas sp.]
MSADMGELLVGAYLKVIEKCDVVAYNQRPPGGGMAGLGELDVIGLRFRDHTAILCEVTTHIGGLTYGKSHTDTIRRIANKHLRQRSYAEAQLREFPNRVYQFWSPRVPTGALTLGLAEIDPELELIINAQYTQRIEELRVAARDRQNDEGNSAFRLLQILEALKR